MKIEHVAKQQTAHKLAATSRNAKNINYLIQKAVFSVVIRELSVRYQLQENVHLCMDMFNCDDVATLLTKRKQKFAGSFAGIDSILCELVVVISN